MTAKTFYGIVRRRVASDGTEWFSLDARDGGQHSSDVDWLKDYVGQLVCLTVEDAKGSIDMSKALDLACEELHDRLDDEWSATTPAPSAVRLREGYLAGKSLEDIWED